VGMQVRQFGVTAARIRSTRSILTVAIAVILDSPRLKSIFGMWGTRDVHQFFFRPSGMKKPGYVPSCPRFVPRSGAASRCTIQE
jgi:hypothetical protein